MYDGKQYLCSMTSRMTPLDVARMLRLRPETAHKGTMGHALLVAGSAGVGGCAVLGAESCLRSGVGKLTVCTPECNRLLLQFSVPEAVLRLLPHGGDDGASWEAEEFARWQAVGIGPGIGLLAVGLLHDVAERSAGLPMVADADALRILAVHPEWMPMLRGRAVLTPHGGEMQALASGILHADAPLHTDSMLLAAAGRLATEFRVWQMGQEAMLARDITVHLGEAWSELHECLQTR